MELGCPCPGCWGLCPIFGISQCKEPTVDWWLCKCLVTWHPVFSLFPLMSLNMLIGVTRNLHFLHAVWNLALEVGFVQESEKGILRKEFCSLVCLIMCMYLRAAMRIWTQCANVAVPVLWMEPRFSERVTRALNCWASSPLYNLNQITFCPDSPGQLIVLESDCSGGASSNSA